mgnify:CR=1 FL=1
MKIEVRNVSKAFKKNIVLEDVNITFEDGYIYGFKGRNGSGKTVLLKIICGIYKATKGQVLYDEKEYNKATEYVPEVRALIEKPCFFPDLTGFENLKILAEIQNTIGPKEIDRALEIVNLFDEKDKRYSKYSLGMKQKLGIAQAIMEDQEILILDEPFNALEKESVEKIKKFLLKEREKGKIIIISSHMEGDLESFADKIFNFEGGKVE